MENESKPQFIQVDFPGFSVTLCSYGASVYSIKVDDHEMLSTFEDKDVWLEHDSYHGKTLGRVAGRIPDAVIEVGDSIYQLEANERGNTLHGGFKGLSFRNFECHVYQYLTHYEVDYTYHSPDMEWGFPGNVDFTVIYKIYRKKTIEIYHKAKSDRLTPINMTQHLYFNMGEKNLDNVYMELKADKRYLLDDNLLKLKLVDVADTAYDFRKGGVIMEHAFKKEVEGPHKHGFDDIWYFGKTNPNYPVAVLESPRYRAEFSTDYNSAVIYMNGYPSQQLLTNGLTEETYSAVTMELTNGEVQYVTPLKPYSKYSRIVFKEIVNGKHS